MNRQQRIEERLKQALSPTHLEVVNETHMHSVPPDAESHYKVTVVSADFEGLPLIQRHKRINSLLADEFASGIHALALHTFTPEEWQARGEQSQASPPCMGGSKQ